MESLDLDTLDQPRRPRTLTVLAMLGLFALGLSYLAVYAGTRVLIQADLMSPFPTDGDPRPRWLFWSFVGLLGSFLTIGGVLGLLGGRKLGGLEECERT
jgi:hypothetical protein